MKIENNVLNKVEVSDIHNGTIRIPTNVNTIGTNAFGGEYGRLSNLTHLIIPQNISLISSFTFANCKNLKEIKIENENCELESETFWNCGLTRIELPKKLREIMEPTFCFLPELKELFIPDTVSHISLDYFFNTENLEKIFWKGKAYTYTDLKEYRIF